MAVGVGLGGRCRRWCAALRRGRRSHPTERARGVPQDLRQPAQHPTAGGPIRAGGSVQRALCTCNDAAGELAVHLRERSNRAPCEPDSTPGYDPKVNSPAAACNEGTSAGWRTNGGGLGRVAQERWDLTIPAASQSIAKGAPDRGAGRGASGTVGGVGVRGRGIAGGAAGERGHAQCSEGGGWVVCRAIYEAAAVVYSAVDGRRAGRAAIRAVAADREGAEGGAGWRERGTTRRGRRGAAGAGGADGAGRGAAGAHGGGAWGRARPDRGGGGGAVRGGGAGDAGRGGGHGKRGGVPATDAGARARQRA